MAESSLIWGAKGADRTDYRGKVARLRSFISYIAACRSRAIYVGASGLPNLGDRILLDAIISLLGHHASVTPELRKARVASRIVPACSPNLTLLGGGTLVKAPGPHLKDLETCLQAFKKSKLVVFGTGVEDIHLWESFGSPTDVKRWRVALNEAEFIGVRGPLSKKHLLEDFGIEKEVSVVGDPALYFARPHLWPKVRDKRIGINLGPSNGFIHGMDEGRVLREMVTVLRELDAEGWKITFVAVTQDDVSYMQDAARIAGIDGWYMHGRYLDVTSVLSILEEQDVFIGEKLHSVVLAACVYTPCLMIEYRTKCRDFMASIDREHWTSRTDVFTSDWILEQVGVLYKSLHEERRGLFESVSYCRERLLIAAQQVIATIDGLNP